MNLMQRLKVASRPTRAIVQASVGYLYDWQRFFMYGGWRSDVSDPRKRAYRAVKLYHSLEKSLSFGSRKEGSGWAVADELIALLEKSKSSGTSGYQEMIAANVLMKFKEAEVGPVTHHRNQAITLLYEYFCSSPVAGGGCIEITEKELSRGVLDDPERYFLTRYSVRDFTDRRVAPEVIQRALRLALKTPSVCNRQAWHVYHTDEPSTIRDLLEFQKGCRGIEDKVPNLLMTAMDLRAFDSAGERYQHWIDGGMFSMSIVLALHALGVCSCCLNWSRSAGDDRKLRELFNIHPEHTVVMMIAVGYPNDPIRVCSSERWPLDEFHSSINRTSRGQNQ